MLTTTPNIEVVFGRLNTQPPPIDMAGLHENHLIGDGLGQQQQQQMPENHDSAFISSLDLTHWTPADCTALIHALVASFSVILVSELGDKTFIITAIMAMKNSRLLVFIASALALLLMTILSVGMGVAVTVIPKLYTHYASIVLFLCFGIKMLKEAHDLVEEGEESEFDEVKRSLEEKNNNDKAKDVVENGADDESQDEINKLTIVELGQQESPTKESDQESILSKLNKTIYVAPIIIKVFMMILIAEWGDRSQISTVILAAREDVVGVFVGSFVGHILCTGLAVIGGRFVADMISVRTSKPLHSIRTFLYYSKTEINLIPQFNFTFTLNQSDFGGRCYLPVLCGICNHFGT